ncbi:PAS domain-containing protein [Ornithinimicrobium sp. Arc0846-15]|nr:PAS domain-containing protein [Ornithinimicrobium laminariae]
MAFEFDSLGDIPADTVQAPILCWPREGVPQANAAGRRLFSTFPGWGQWRTLDDRVGLDELCRSALRAPVESSMEVVLTPSVGDQYARAIAPRLLASLVRHTGTADCVTVTMSGPGGLSGMSESERLQLERAELAMSLSGAPFWDWNLETNEVHLSDSWYRSLGYEPRELPMNQALWESALHPDDLQNTWDALNRYVEGVTEKYDFINRMRRKDGSYRWNRDQGFIIERGPDGRPSRMIGIDRDIDEEFALYEQLRRVQRPGSIGTLTSGIAHDFNNILSPILMLSEMAKDNLDDPEQVTEWLGEIETAAIRARDLIRQLMRLTRQSEDEWRPVSVAEVVESTLPLISRTASSNTKVQTEISGAYAVMCDPVNIEQIVLNLCTNALQAMPDGGQLNVRVRDTTFRGNHFGLRNALTDGAEVVEITVTDTGVGIPLEAQHDIFDPYFTTKARGEGTGLGLSVVYGLVSDYGGAVVLESELGHGTTFHVFLPRTSLEAVARPSRRAAISLADRLVLLAEDDPATLRSMQQALEHAGLTIVTAGDGVEAQRIFDADPHAIDVVISDLMMPVMNGDQLARHIKDVRPTLPFIMLSGYGQQQADRSAVDAWLSKPTTIVEVLYVIRSLLFGDVALPASSAQIKGERHALDLDQGNSPNHG